MTSTVFNIHLNVIDYEQSKQFVSQAISLRTSTCKYIVQANVATVVNASEDNRYSEAVRAATLSVPDGMPLVWLLRLKGHPIKDRVYGPDLMLMLCEEAARRGWRCYLYGGAAGVPEELGRVLTLRFPGLNIVGTYSPPFRDLSPVEDDAICAMINATKPDILWVGLGSPKQDIWMYEHREKLDVSVLHGVGAAFDFLTGRVKQAPRWMMSAGLEWLFRLLQEPRRLWRRYTVTNIKFFYYLLRSLFKRSS